MKKVKIFLLRYFYLRGFLTWDSWNGFGVSTNWPDTDWERDIIIINGFLERYLPEDWVINGPCFAAGGVIVMYAWPKDDPHVRELFAISGSPMPKFCDCLKKMRELTRMSNYMEVEK